MRGPSFVGAVALVLSIDAGSALLTVTGTGTIGDTKDCVAAVTGCKVTTTACASGVGSSIAYDLTTYPNQISGTAAPTIPGGCVITYSLMGTR